MVDDKLSTPNEQNRITSDDNTLSSNSLNENESIPMDIKLDVTSSNINSNGEINTNNLVDIKANTNMQSLPQNTIPIPMQIQTMIPIPSQTQTQQSLQSQAQMEFLGAIQPKLKLLWSGYGPATVVKQFGIVT
jgi:hypothetical protein